MEHISFKEWCERNGYDDEDRDAAADYQQVLDENGEED